MPGLSCVSHQCNVVCMSTVAEIKAAISQLTLAERSEVGRCLHEWEDDAWDKQIQQDLAAGKLDGLLAKVYDDIDHGKLRDMPLSPRRRRISGVASTGCLRKFNSRPASGSVSGRRMLSTRHSISNRCWAKCGRCA